MADSNPTVVANAVAALTEISERSDNLHLRLNTTVASKLVSAMGECSECVDFEFPPFDSLFTLTNFPLFRRWGQTYILEALMYYVPEEHQDAELLAERIAIRLQHSNSAVVLTTIKVILYLMNYMGSQEVVDSMCRKLSPPLGKLFFPRLGNLLDFTLRVQSPSSRQVTKFNTSPFETSSSLFNDGL